MPFTTPPYLPPDNRFPIIQWVEDNLAAPFDPQSPFISAFGLLSANPETPIVTIDYPYNINSSQVNTTTANGGTVTQANSQAVLQTGTNSAGSAILESIISARYSPGQGQIGRFTAAFTAGKANSQQEIGIGDSTDGFFFGYQGATFGIFRRQNGTDFFIPQSQWNGLDRFDGNGPSGATINPTLGNVYMIRYQWLGYGAIRYWIEDPTTGVLTLVHTILYANTVITPSVFNPNLPVHARVVNSGNATNLTLLSASMGIYAEGPPNETGVRWSVGNRKTGITTETSVFALQNKSTFAGATNRARIHVDSIGSALSGGPDSQYRLVLNPTLGGSPSFTDIATTQSVAAFDVAGTTVTGGRELRRGPSTGNFQASEDISSMEIRINPGDVLVCAVSSFAGGVAGNLSLSWREEL